MTRIYFNEVVTRDGFQIEPHFMATDDKVALIDALSQCGYAKIEATSFTSPKAIPMLRDAEEVMGRIARVPGVEYTVLVPNLRGAERALESRADELNLVMSTSETHNLANLRMTREQSFAALAEVVRHVDGRTPINVSLSTCFGCPMEGDVPQAVVQQFAQRFADMGVRGLTICDTTGMAHPAQVKRCACTRPRGQCVCELPRTLDDRRTEKTWSEARNHARAHGRHLRCARRGTFARGRSRGSRHPPLHALRVAPARR